MTLPAATSLRYTKVAVILHWLIALSILTLLASGLTMKYAPLEKFLQFKIYQWHKSLGVIVLWLVALRVIWRIFHKPPPLPTIIPKFEAWAAHAGHYALYFFMILMPISGWLLVSSSSFGLPTIVFGWFQWPHFPGVAGDKSVNDAATAAHWYGTWVILALIVGHVGAVGLHYVKERVNLLPRMWFKGKNDVL